LIERLLKQAQGISASLHGVNPLKGSEARARDAAGLLSEFVGLLAQVDLLLRLEDEARRLLEGELSGAREVLEVADSEFEVARKAVGGGGMAEAVRAADLSDPLEQVTKATWLQLLRDAARRGDREVFRKEVLRGATGLTEAGLREVLGLRPQATIADAHLEMASRMGRMYDPDGNPYEAPWWAATSATPTMEYEYRILPWLIPELQAVFQRYTESQPTRFRYIFHQNGKNWPLCSGVRGRLSDKASGRYGQHAGLFDPALRPATPGGSGGVAGETDSQRAFRPTADCLSGGRWGAALPPDSAGSGPLG
jgi:hypothetical protein